MATVLGVELAVFKGVIKYLLLYLCFRSLSKFIFGIFSNTYHLAYSLLDTNCQTLLGNMPKVFSGTVSCFGNAIMS